MIGIQTQSEARGVAPAIQNSRRRLRAGARREALRLATTFSAIEAPARSIQRLFVGSWAWFTCALCSEAWEQPRDAGAPEESTSQPAADSVVPPRAIGDLAAAY